MAISVDPTSSYINAVTNQAQNNAATSKTSKVNSSINNINVTSTKEELTDAVKSFEQYFVEEMLKTMKDSVKAFSSDKDKSDPLTDYYMDFAIKEVAQQMVDQYGERITKDFVSQILRNYGIADDADVNQTTGEDSRS